MNLKVSLKKNNPDVPDPVRQHSDDVGADLTVVSVKKVRDGVFLLDLGVSASPPAGYYLELHCRSSIYKTDFMQANKVGIIDPGYTGTLFMPVRYLGAENADAAAQELVGKRFAQLILRKREPFEIALVDELPCSDRGSAGLGSTGA